jgi:hypothetical protein
MKKNPVHIESTRIIGKFKPAAESLQVDKKGKVIL